MNYVGCPNRDFFGNQYGFGENPINFLSQVPIDVVQFIKNLYQTDNRYFKNNVQSIESENYSEDSFEYPTSSRIETLSFLSAIIYPNPEELRFFIQHHHVYLHGILYACKVAFEMFNQENQLSLEVEQDPISGKNTLVLFIRSNNYPDNFHDKIKLLRKIYRNSGFSDSDDFAITTDYQPPLSL